MDTSILFFNPYSFNLYTKIADGHYGPIYKVMNTNIKQQYAAKIIEKNISENDQREIFDDIIVLNHIQHPAIVQFGGFDFNSIKNMKLFQTTILTEFCPKNTIKSLLAQAKENDKSDVLVNTNKYILLLGITNALIYLKQMNIYHCNIMAHKILLNNEYEPKINFQRYHQRFDDIDNFDTMIYFAPEILLAHEYGPSADIYAFGILAYQIITGQTPYVEFKDKTPIDELRTKIILGHRPVLPKSITEPLRLLFLRMWANDPNDRPSFEEIFGLLIDSPYDYFKDDLDETKIQAYYHRLPVFDIESQNVEIPEKRPMKFLSNALCCCCCFFNCADCGCYDSDNYCGSNPIQWKHNNCKVESVTKDLIFSRNEKAIFRYIDVGNFKQKQKIDEGKYYEVYKVQHYENQKIFAAKIAKRPLVEPANGEFLTFLKHIAILSKVKHFALLDYIGFNFIDFKYNPRPVIFIEYMENGSLDLLIKAEKKNPGKNAWDNTKKLITLYGVASAMAYLHSRCILHMDLKPKNVLINGNFYPKVTDFAQIKQAYHNLLLLNINDRDDSSIRSKLKKIAVYISPEVMQTNVFTKENDVYAFGMLVYEIFTLNHPFEEIKNPLELRKRVLEGYRPPIPNNIHASYKKIIERCWLHNPEQRPSFDKIVEELEVDRGLIIEGVNNEEYREYINMIKASLPKP